MVEKGLISWLTNHLQKPPPGPIPGVIGVATYVSFAGIGSKIAMFENKGASKQMKHLNMLSITLTTPWQWGVEHTYLSACLPLYCSHALGPVEYAGSKIGFLKTSLMYYEWMGFPIVGELGVLSDNTYTILNWIHRLTIAFPLNLLNHPEIDDFPYCQHISSPSQIPTYWRNATSTTSYCVHCHINISSLGQIHIVEASLSEGFWCYCHITSPYHIPLDYTI